MVRTLPQESAMVSKTFSNCTVGETYGFFLRTAGLTCRCNSILLVCRVRIHLFTSPFG